MQEFANALAGDMVIAVAAAVIENRAYLSELDGKIGDGDHGINMAKGFGIAAERVRGRDISLATAFDTLGTVLMTEIGGSMGPLYGVMFAEFAEAIDNEPLIDAKIFGAMLTNGLDGIQSVGSAKVGDKTLLDALVPGIAAFNGATAAGKSFAEALDDLIAAAEKGRDSTKNMIAKVGRASRLGERSRGVQDAGATSCALILKSLAEAVRAKL